MRVGVAIFVGLVMTAAPASAQAPRALTLDDRYDPAKRIDFSGGAPSAMAWVSDSHYVWPKAEAGGVAWQKVEAATGTAVALFDPKVVSDRAAEALGLESAVIGRALNSRGLETRLPTATSDVGRARR